MIRTKLFAFSAALFAISISSAFAEQHTAGVPVLNSRPGAVYSLYVDFAGFNYVGNWNNNVAGIDKTPGFTPSYNDAAPTGTFTTDEQTAIKTVWARLAQSYSGLDINVTTVDPAPAVIQLSDTERRDYYDATPNMMHMIIGSSARAEYVNTSVPSTDPAYNVDGNWFPGADGVSPGIGIASGRVDGPNALQGQHTSFMFSQGRADNSGVITTVNAEYVGGIASHENAHSFGLAHQGDYSGGGTNHINEYSFGDDNDGIYAKPGTYVPIIGDANFNQRIAWRIGTTDETTDNGAHYPVVNDLQKLIAQSSAAHATDEGRSGGADLHFINDGKGHSLATATPLPLVGNTVDFTQAKGVIVPLSESNPVAMGAANYTQDWFSFLSDGINPISLSAIDSTDFLVPGVADSAGTLNSTLGIFNFSGSLIATATEDVTTLIDTYSGLLAAGSYYAAIGSFGGHQQINAANYDAAYYFDTGAYFLTGSGFASVPEPGCAVLFLFAVSFFYTRRASR